MRVCERKGEIKSEKKRLNKRGSEVRMRVWKVREREVEEILKRASEKIKNGGS